MERDIIDAIERSKGIKVDRDESTTTVTGLWNDSGISLRFKDTDPNNDLYKEIMRNVIFPPTLRAIYHEDLHSMEFIYRIGPRFNEPETSFTLRHAGSVYTCGFREGSVRLAMLALFARTSPNTFTDNKNLDLLRAGIFSVIDEYSKNHKRKDSQNIEDIIQDSNFIQHLSNNILSFWVEGLDINDENMHYVLNIINFYMLYYNRHTPLIIIDQEDGHTKFDIPVFPKGTFLNDIHAINIDENALDILISSVSPDPYKKYIQLYQVLEYYTYYYYDKKLRENIHSSIIRPDLHIETDEIVNEIIDQVIKYANNNSIVIKIENLINNINIQSALAHMSKFSVLSESYSLPTNVDIKPVYTDKKYDTKNLSTNLVTLRNSMVHSKERRNKGRLLHTRSNMEYVKLWAEILQSIVMDIMIYIRKGL